MEQLTHIQDYDGKQIQGTRDYQEDDFGFDTTHLDAFIMVLADGMGGYSGGDTASSSAIKAFLNAYNSNDERTTSERLEFSMETANAMLAKIISEKPELEGMGCTFVGAVISKKFSRLHWISVGDSPFWLFRNGLLSRLNIDHSKRTELLDKVEKGEITSDELAKDPERNSLMSALTGEPPALVDNNIKSLEVGDVLLLASDGILTLSEREIEKIIKQADNSAEDLTNRLLGAVNRKARPGQDNTTVLAVKIPPPSVVDDLALAPFAYPKTDSLSGESTNGRSKEAVLSKQLRNVFIAILLLLALAGAFILGGMYSTITPKSNVDKVKPITSLTNTNLEKKVVKGEKNSKPTNTQAK